MIALAMLSVAVSQLPTPLALDEATMAGRVCFDADGDGRCGAGDPGASGVRVMLETGHWAVTDRDGRYHITALPGRSFEAEGDAGFRLVLGRHRLKVDALTLDEGAEAYPAGATVEVSLGGLVVQDFAIRQAGREVATVKRSQAPPRGELSEGGLRVQLTGEVGPEERVVVRGEGAQVDPSTGVYRAWVTVRDGANRVPLRVDAKGNRSRFYIQTVDVSRRAGSVLIAPRVLEAVGSLAVPASATGDVIVSLEAAPGTKATVAGIEVELPAAGRLSIPLPPARRPSLPVRWVTPSGDEVVDDVKLEPASGVSVSALGDFEVGYQLTPGVVWAGRGAAAVRGRLLGFDFSGELDLRDQDLRTLANGDAASFFVPRDVKSFERALVPTERIPQWADDSASIAENPAQARVRAEVSREGVGRLGFGSYRATVGSAAEIGRQHRSLTAAYLEARTPDEAAFGGGIKAFYAPQARDAVLGLSVRQAHERFEATGGSLYYLSSPAVQGSERVRVELLDGVTGLPVGERHLQRGVDYAIDSGQGRIVLAQPLWGFGGPVSGAAPPTASVSPVLWVDYEKAVFELPQARIFGGEVAARAGPVSLSAAYASEQDHQLLRASASAQVGMIWLGVEVARSIGVGGAEAVRWSDDGGLTFATMPDVSLLTGVANAFTARARGRGLFGRGRFELAFRMRDRGFVDATHADFVPSQQISAYVEQPVGDFVVGGTFDRRKGADPRVAFSQDYTEQLVAGGHVGFERPKWGVRLEGRDVEFGEPSGSGGRASVGLSGRYQVTDWLTLRAGHRQSFAKHGSGAGAFDDTFASAGVDVTPSDDVQLGVRGGWGPTIGVQLWGQGMVRSGDEVWYGGHGLDVDAPALGERRTVTGARREVEPGTSVYAEDAAVHDLTSLRLSRAVGLTQKLPLGFTLSARYERGVRQPVDVQPDRQRDAGGVSLVWVGTRARAWARGEVRSERGTTPDLLQVLAWGGGEASLLDDVRLTLSALYSHSTLGGALSARVFDGTAALAWRFAVGMVVARYSFRREILPSSPIEKTRHIASLLPSVQAFGRLTIAAGAHVLVQDGGIDLIASLRPSVRIIGDLEVAAEGARRSRDTDGQGVWALRAEVGYRFQGRFLLAVGGTIIGFQNIDVAGSGQSNRIYLRGEVAW